MSLNGKVQLFGSLNLNWGVAAANANVVAMIRPTARRCIKTSGVRFAMESCERRNRAESAVTMQGKTVRWPEWSGFWPVDDLAEVEIAVGTIR